MTRFDRIFGGRGEERMTLEGLAELVESFKYQGITYGNGVQTTYGKTPTEPLPTSFEGYVRQAYQANGIVFACIAARLLLFTEVRFTWQRYNAGKPAGFYSTPELDTLHKPWVGGTSGDLLARMEQDASLAGTAYVYRAPGSNMLKRLRPDWVEILIGGDPWGLDAHVAGLYYWPGGPSADRRPIILFSEDVAIYAPIPDPLAHWRGQSWMTPVLEEIGADKAATRHKGKFFENGATPNMVVKYPREATAEQVREFAKFIDENQRGVGNAYKTLHIGGGADPMVVGADMRQIDFKVTQGAGETRIAAAASVPPIIAGFSEGLEASTYSNYGQARRKFADGWGRPAWRSVCGALENIVPAPDDASRLWYDASDVSFLQEDERDAAGILKEKMLTIESAVRSGYTPDSAAAAVDAGDLTLLEHTGLYSVQLQPPGTGTPTGA